jgi:hypothetical protein
MILPGCESLNGDVSVAWCWARKASTPRAKPGLSHSICKAEITPSRPNAVENQGMPA